LADVIDRGFVLFGQDFFALLVILFDAVDFLLAFGATRLRLRFCSVCKSAISSCCWRRSAVTSDIPASLAENQAGSGAGFRFRSFDGSRSAGMAQYSLCSVRPRQRQVST